MRFYSSTEAARMLGVSVTTLLRWVDDGCVRGRDGSVGPAPKSHRLGGVGPLRFEEDDLREFMGLPRLDAGGRAQVEDAPSRYPDPVHLERVLKLCRKGA